MATWREKLEEAIETLKVGLRTQVRTTRELQRKIEGLGAGAGAGGRRSGAGASLFSRIGQAAQAEIVKVVQRNGSGRWSVQRYTVAPRASDGEPELAATADAPFEAFDMCGGAFVGAACVAMYGGYSGAGSKVGVWMLVAGQCAGFNARLTGAPTEVADGDTPQTFEGVALVRREFDWETAAADRWSTLMPAHTSTSTGMKAIDLASRGSYPKTLMAARVAYSTLAPVRLIASYAGNAPHMILSYGVEPQTKTGCT